MRFLFLCCAGLLCAALAQTEQLSLILLNTEAYTGKLPGGWQVKVNRGVPDVSAARESDRTFLRLRSKASSYGLERSVDVDPAQLPWLTWNWKVTELPRGGDFRSARTDDQAAQVLVAFADRRILTYIWDTTAPKGLMQSASAIPLIRIVAVVAESGPQAANQWLREAHNVRDDYQRAFGRSAPRVKGIRLQINSQHTRSSAESYFGEVAFRANNQ